MRKILFILSNLSGGGAEKAFIDLMRHTDFSAYEIDLCLMMDSGIYMERLPGEVGVIPLYPANSFRYKLLLFFSKYFHFDLPLRSAVRRKINKKYDTVISFCEGIPLKIHSQITDRGGQNVAWIHTNLADYHYTKKYFYTDEDEADSYGQMDRLIFVSRGACKNFESLYHLDVCKSVVYNPIDRQDIIAKALSFPVHKDRFTVCTVGRLIDAKGYDRLLRVAKLLIDSGRLVDFWILGDGPLRIELMRLREELGLEDYVRFLGFQANPYSYMAVADLFLSTSRVEGYPLVVCEALCLGRPVVATEVAGCAEILGNSEYGILTGHDDESIFKALAGIIDCPDKLEDLHQRAVKRSLIFDIKEKVSEIYNLIG